MEQTQRTSESVGSGGFSIEEQKLRQLKLSLQLNSIPARPQIQVQAAYFLGQVGFLTTTQSFQAIAALH